MKKVSTKYEKQYANTIDLLMSTNPETGKKELAAKTAFKKQLKEMLKNPKEVLIEEVEMRQDTIRRLYREKDSICDQLTNVSNQLSQKCTEHRLLNSDNNKLIDELNIALDLLESLTKAVVSQTRATRRRIT